MGNKEIDLENIRHNNRMEQLQFERETTLLAIDREWFNRRKQIIWETQRQHPNQQMLNVPPQINLNEGYEEDEEDYEEEEKPTLKTKSSKKYGRPKLKQ